ncbi:MULTISPECIES: DotI/IcmL family type IV secretion protein [unclassified Burkholderia]|uniref:DotI/IcmL family type IV secretion protein n=1 Tax=unclassified Burkholderia TaxID=2613784 RepID=UPI002AB23D3F|nr:MULTISPECIES: DotI/IcmL family type IV secretion protein [unclassified Burkholderia]
MAQQPPRNASKAGSIQDGSTMNDGLDAIVMTVDRLSKMLVAAVIGLAGLAIAVAILAWFVTHKHPDPVGIDPHGNVIPLVRLDVAYLDDNRVAGFADETLRVSFAHDFENYPYTMNALSDRYTPSGFESFKEAMAPFIMQMKQKRYVMSLSIDRPPVVVEHGVDRNGAYTWTLQSMVYVNRQGSEDRMPPTKYTAVMVVTRIPLAENLRGISTTSVNLSPAT